MPLLERLRRFRPSPDVVVFTTGMTGAYVPFLRSGAAAVELAPPPLVRPDDDGAVESGKCLRLRWTSEIACGAALLRALFSHGLTRLRQLTELRRLRRI